MAEIDIRVTGADKLREVAKRMKAAGDKEMRKEFLRALRVAGKPLTEAAKAGALRDLPHGGGLATEVAASGFSIRTRSAGNSPGIRVVAKGKKVRALSSLDRGRLRHPVWGNANVWVTQAVKPGWFTDAMAARAEQVQAEMLAAMDAVLEKI
jgi:hypothetical protein